MKPQKTTIMVIMICLPLLSLAQKEIEKQVNQQVWKPFIESWTNNDHKTFNALHTDDVLRASSNGIRQGHVYKNGNTTSMIKNAESYSERSMQLWFEHRVYSEAIGYEVGYYKIHWKRGDSEGTSYARFHIVLKKINGVWKVAQDWDTSNINGHKVTEEDWLKGRPLRF